jgi:lipopolysaccharide transport system permease protein
LARAGDEWIIEPRASGALTRVREAWKYRALLGYFAARTVERTYQGTLLGWVWLLLRPLVPVLIGTFLFNELAGIQSGPIPYFLFALVGVTIWSVFEDGLMWETRSLQMYRRLMTKLYFPRIILPIATLGVSIVNFLIRLGLLVAVSVYFRLTDGSWYVVLGLNSLLAVVALGLALLVALGLGLFTSVLGAETRDLRFTLGYILSIWFFVTPVVYPASLFPPEYQWLAAINPMAVVVELFRWGLFGAGAPLDVGFIAAVTMALLVLCGLGYWFFMVAETATVDKV